MLAPRRPDHAPAQPCTSDQMGESWASYLSAALGFFWAVCSTAAMPRESPVEVEVIAAVQRLLRHGLPVGPTCADTALLRLRGVVARAVDPLDDASRLTALNGTLRGLLARFSDVRYASATRALFGLPPSQPGQNLTVRRELAAAEANHEVHHFRKRVEPKLIEKIAWELLADADRFTRSPAIAPRLAPASSRRPIPADPFAWEVADHEEALTRLWAAIYALRAELLTVERLLSFGADRQQVSRQAVTAAWRWAQASLEATSYTLAFAPEADDAGELVALAGWTPPLTGNQAAQLREAAADGADRAAFVVAMHHEDGPAAAWIEGFLDALSMETTEGFIS